MYTSGTYRQTQGLPASHRRVPRVRRQALPSSIRTFIPPTSIGAWRTIGWITGHSYIATGPLALAATSVLYEGVPPISRRRPPLAHRRAPRCKISSTLLHRHSHASQGRRRRTTEIQLPLQAHDHRRRAHRAGSLEMVFTTWSGKGKAVIVDTWWQTETGGVLCSTKPALATL